MRRILVTSASAANGDGYGAILSFDLHGRLLEAFSEDPRVVDPRGMALDQANALIYVNSGDDRVLALDHTGQVIRDSGRIAGLDPGGGTFGPDGRYCVGARRLRTILAMPADLDGAPEQLLPDGVVPFPRGFGFGADGRLYLASGIAPSGQGDDAVLVFDPGRTRDARRLVTDPGLSPLDLLVAPNGNVVVYCVGEEHVVAFEFATGRFAGPVLELSRLNGQALVLLA